MQSTLCLSLTLNLRAPNSSAGLFHLSTAALAEIDGALRENRIFENEIITIQAEAEAVSRLVDAQAKWRTEVFGSLEITLISASAEPVPLVLAGICDGRGITLTPQDHVLSE